MQYSKHNTEHSGLLHGESFVVGHMTIRQQASSQAESRYNTTVRTAEEVCPVHTI